MKLHAASVLSFLSIYSLAVAENADDLNPSTTPSSVSSSMLPSFATSSSWPSTNPSHSTEEPSLKPSEILSAVPSSHLLSPGPSTSPSLSKKPIRLESNVPSETKSQTPSESLAPSNTPTLDPLETPSFTPSQTPSVTSSLTPSGDPSSNPSASSSDTPSQNPSLASSLPPSETLSSSPSGSPSLASSLPPSETISSSPSGSPSDTPTETRSPSLASSPTPSSTISSSPSGSPSDIPTQTQNPSLASSLTPSETISSSPSSSPSVTPTQTQNPSLASSLTPSETISSSPSDIPSQHPSLAPSLPPSNIFSSVPSGSPSKSPSLLPTEYPSTAPSRSPTYNPTFHPSKHPSVSPTVTPKMECTSIYTIVEELGKLSSKASKQAKRVGSSGNPTPSPTNLSKRGDEEFFCSQINEWQFDNFPQYKTQVIRGVSANGAEQTYPVAIKLASGSPFGVDENGSRLATLVGFTQAGLSRNDRVNIIEATTNGTVYSKNSVRASLRLAESFKLDNWQGTGKDLIISFRDTERGPAKMTRHAVIELNFAYAVVPNDSMANLIICGYQGWFTYPGDGAPIDRWRHWFRQEPSINDLTVEMYPYNNEYNDEDLIESNILMKDGSRAKFYSAARPNVVKTHFKWMQEYGISGVFHMRFMSDIDKKKNRDWKTMVLRNVMAAAEATGRIFAVSYNIAGNNIDNSVLDDLKNDWIKLVDEEHITLSNRYLHHNGLPVLRIYGIGFNAVNVSDANKVLELIQWFQTEADLKYRVFLIGGVPSRWRDLSGDSRSASVWQNVYESLDGIHPWHVGRWSSIEYFDWWHANRIAKDAERCSQLGILYMPTMWPGFSWHNLKGGGPEVNEIPRQGGRFMWQQAYQYIKDDNISSIWMAQFDEVDEGTAIYKVAATQQEVPAEGKWLSLDADGTQLPNDWYLKLCGEAQKMMRGEIGLTDTIPISP